MRKENVTGNSSAELWIWACEAEDEGYAVDIIYADDDKNIIDRIYVGDEEILNEFIDVELADNRDAERYWRE